MCDTLQCVTHRVCEVVHGVDAPLVPCDGVRGPLDAVQSRVSKVHIGTKIIYFSAENALSIREFPLLHVLEQSEVLLNGPGPVGGVLAGLCESAPVLPHLLCREKGREGGEGRDLDRSARESQMEVICDRMSSIDTGQDSDGSAIGDSK